MSASGVRAGKVFVEIGADPKAFFSALNRVNKSIGNIGRAMAGAGSRLMAGGVGMAAPIAAAVSQGAKFESTLLNIKASTGATAGEIDRIKSASMAMSAALGVGPTEAAQGMLELLKAGMSLESVLGGAGQSALEFAKVGEMDVAQAAVVMSDAMNVFGVSGGKAANTLSAAADASSTSIAQMAEAFSMSSAVAGLANQSIDDLSATLAILANAGVKGSDAGTSVKTMLMRLMAPADDAAEAMAQVGLSVQSFRGADGKMRPMVEILGTLNAAMGNLDQAAKDDVFRRIFGADAIRAASILSSAGVDGFNGMLNSMSQALPVGEKFKTMMSGLAGAGLRLLAGLERVAIAISDAVGPALQSIVPFIEGALNGFAKFTSENKAAVALFAQVAVAVFGVGGALTGLGLSLQLASFGFAGLGKGIALALSPMMALGKVAMFTGGSFSHVAAQVGGFAASGVGSVLSFATKSGVALAKASAGFGSIAVNAAVSAASISTAMTGTALAGLAQFVRGGIAAFAQYSAKSTALVAITAGQAGSMATAQVAATVSVISATVARAAEGNVRAAAIGVQALARLGVAGTTNALIAGAQVARLSAQGSTQLIRLGASGTTALAAIGSTAVSVGSTAGGSLAKAAASGTSALTRLGTSGAGGLVAIGTAAVRSGGLALASLARAAMVGIAQAGAMTAAWVGGLAKMSASAVLSGAAMAVSFAAPFVAIGAAIAAAIAVVYAFREQLSSAFAIVSEWVSQAAGAIGEGFSTAISDAVVVFGDLFGIAQTTFGGIYDAVVSSDLSGAMDILWAGLQAGWLRGVEGLMSYVDPWIATFKNTFVALGTEIAVAWDSMTTMLASTQWGATLLGAVDNIINGVMAAFDVMVATVRKSWNYVQSFMVKGYDLARENKKVDSEMAARARERSVNRPGIAGRTAKAAAEGDAMRAASASRIDAMRAGAAQTMQDNLSASGPDRAAQTAAAEQRLADLTQGAAMKRADIQSLPGIQDALASVKSMTELGSIGQQISGLMDRDTLTADQESAALEAYRKAQQRLAAEVAPGASAGVEPPPPSTQSMGAIAGSFSSLNLGQAFGGTSLAERTARAAEETARNTRDMKGDKVAA